MMNRLTITLILVSISGFLAGCAGTPVPDEVGLRPDGGIPDPAPPPSSPNCVSSYVDPAADPDPGADPILRGEHSAEEARVLIRTLLETEKRVDILTDIPGYLHAVQYTALWKFPDDVEFWFPDDEDVIHYRSAARLGKSDLGVNRKRMERIRAAYTVSGE